VIINLNGLPALLWLLDHPKKNIRKEACWTISNVTAGTSEQIQGVINANLIPKLIQLLNVAEFEIQKESAWALSNATSGGTPEQIFFIVSQVKK
jgi:importin subunit alpha-1